MRTWLLSTWLLSLFIVGSSGFALAQTSPPDECKCPPAVRERLSKYLSPTAASAIQQCSKQQSAGCETEVTVKKLDDGSCLATMPYCVLCVRPKDTGSSHPKYPKLKWWLSENGQVSKNFVFDTNRGIDIPGAGQGGKDYLDSPGLDGAKPRFKWQTGADHSPALAHEPTVSPISDPNMVCKWVDPIIVNSDQ